MTTSTLPFSSLRRIENTVYLSGELGFDASGQIVGDITRQTKTTLNRIEATLAGIGLSRRDIVSCTCYLVHKHDFSGFNEAYRTFFSEGDLPVRTTVVTDLVLDALIEITVTAQAQEL
ncbi:reactive intermediate/imine deaminase [Rhizobium anhuiense]|uniref:RidA family protein n=1 Tax=Rhizobium anhuiense TaxID=1184720 RepID=UPI000BE821D1|nr:RidA family protein [Rhizobium anhuiense]PDS41253.1 reactive intermediate/imine deaminase [Rhizobium anhuiense]